MAAYSVCTIGSVAKNAQLSRDEQVPSATLFNLENNTIDFCCLSCLLIMG